MPILWTSNLATGIPAVDRQHRLIFARLDALVAAVRSNRPDEVGFLLEFLGDYVVSHFDTEEMWMAACAYPGYEAHKAAHETFVASYRSLRAKYELHGATFSVVTRAEHWIGAWFENHIARVDLEMARGLRARPARRV